MANFFTVWQIFEHVSKLSSEKMFGMSHIVQELETLVDVCI